MKIQTNKFLTFCLGNEFYGIPILKVKEIIGMCPITPVPGMPEYIKGIINLRGKIITTLDLRLKFKFEPINYTDKTCIIIVEIDSNGTSFLSGLIVDAVSEVLDIDENNIELPPTYGNNINLEFLTGLGNLKDKVVMILDTNKIICHQDTNKILDLNNIE